MARGLGLLLTAMLVVRCLIEVLAPHFEVLNKRLYIFGSAINTCAMDLVIVAIGALIFCLYGMVAFHIKKSLQYIYFQCNGYSAIVLVLSCSSVLHVIGMFFLVRSFWTAKLPVIIQILHLVPSTTVALEVILQGLYLLCRRNARGREQPAIEHSTTQILGSSNLVFIAYSLTLLVVVVHRRDAFFIFEVVVIFLEIFGRAYRIVLLLRRPPLPPAEQFPRDVSAPVQECCRNSNSKVVKIIVCVEPCKKIHYVPLFPAVKRRQHHVAQNVDRSSGCLASHKLTCSKAGSTDLMNEDRWVPPTQLASTGIPKPFLGVCK